MATARSSTFDRQQQQDILTIRSTIVRAAESEIKVRFAEGVKDSKQTRRRKKKMKTVFGPRASITNKRNVYNALMHSDNNQKLIKFSGMDEMNKAALANFFKSCVDHLTYGSVVELTDERLAALRSGTPLFDRLPAESKHHLETLFKQWPGLEYMSPAYVAPNHSGSMESSSRGLNSYDEVVRDYLPDSITETLALRVTMIAAKKEAAGCGMSSEDFEEMVPNIFNTGFQKYDVVLAEIMSDYPANIAHNDNNSVASQKQSVRSAAYNLLDYWAGLFPVSFSGNLRNRLFVEEADE